MLRCVITCGSDLTTGTVAGLFTRTAQNDRTPDMLRLAGQLYGVRGVDSRYEYTYIDSDGEIWDARNDSDLWEALELMNNLWDEGLIYQLNYDTSVNKSSDTTYLTGGNATEGFMMYDFVQTQTSTGFSAENEGVSGKYQGTLSSTHNFAPVINPVSKWSVNDDDDTIMRFTESWRSTKTSGIIINGAVENDTSKLIACLKFVDYLFSNDGQILMTYGPMAAGEGNDTYGDGGWWYNTEVSVSTIDSGATALSDLVGSGVSYDSTSGQYYIDKSTSDLAATYFIYNNKIYTGTYYKGYTAPTITTELYNSFVGLGAVASAITGLDEIKGAIQSFTNYARYIIGSTLPVAVKDQCFEYQLTSQMGKAGADNVSVALVNGALKGMSLDASDGYWYMVVPTGLPFTSGESSTMSGQSTLQYITGTLYNSDNKNVYSVFQYVIMYGLNGGTYNSNNQTWVVGQNVSDMLTNMEDAGSVIREEIIQSAWTRLKGWYNI